MPIRCLLALLLSGCAYCPPDRCIVLDRRQALQLMEAQYDAGFEACARKKPP